MAESWGVTDEESSSERELGSILVIDLGEEAARAHLFGLVEGAPRFLAAASGPAGTAPTALLEGLGQASARSLINGGALISPQQDDGDGVDHVFLIVDGPSEDQAPESNDALLAGTERIDRGAAGRTALDLLAARMGRMLLAVDFDLDTVASTSPEADRETAYAALRDAVAGIGQQLSLNDGQARVNVIDIGPSLLAGPLAVTILAIVDGCGLRPESGVITLAADREGLLLPLGAIATHAPAYASAIFAQDFLSPLGSYLAIEPPEGEATDVLSGTLSAGFDTPLERFDLAPGSLRRLDLERGASGELTLELAPGAHLGNLPEREPVCLTAPDEITGGPLGIILDARSYPREGSDEPELVSGWLDELRWGDLPNAPWGASETRKPLPLLPGVETRRSQG